MNQYRLNEIFYSLQGEGMWAGTPMVFVRFAGCNLRCHFCDTNHKVKHKMSLTSLILHLRDQANFHRPICFTGGEPTLQLDPELLAGLPYNHLHIETNGTKPVLPADNWRCITVSPKRLPTEEIRRHPQPFGSKDISELKVVLDDATPERWAHTASLLEAWGVMFKHCFIQPCYGPKGPNLDRAIAFVKSHEGWRLSLQLHKMLKIR